MNTYTVKQGDTLSAIAVKFNTTVDEIMKLNTFIKNRHVIKVGWVLHLPTKTQTRDYTAIVTALDKAVADIKKLDSVNQLLDIM